MSPVLDPVMAFVSGRGRKRFGLEELVEATGHTRKQCLRACDKLVKEGYLVEVRDRPVKPDPGKGGPALRNPTWRTADDRDLGERRRARVDATLRARMWRLIRMRRQFTRTDLERLTGASRSSVRLYTHILERGGVIRKLCREGRDTVYLLRKDSVDRPRLPEPTGAP